MEFSVGFSLPLSKFTTMEIISKNDLYVVIEINLDDIVKSQPMTRAQVNEYILSNYADQPLKYFNESGRIQIIHLESASVKQAKLIAFL